MMWMVRILVLVLAPVVALAGGWAASYRLTDGVVAVTNTQANSTWAPVAVLWRFDEVTNAVVRVERVSQGTLFVLGVASVSNGTCAVWVPEAEYPFALGEVLRVGSTVTNGVVQVIRKGE
jgi:hypothetical protein